MSTKPYIKHLSWKKFVELKKGTNLVIIPSGAVEVYGPHLPLGTDTIVATRLAESVTDHVESMIGPVLEVGDSSMLDDFPGTLVVSPEHFKSYIYDVSKSLIKWGFKDFLFINSHLGNVSLINQVADQLRREPEIRCAQIDVWRFVKNHSAEITETGDLAHGHASEAGTSVMLFFAPELVDKKEAIQEWPKRTDLYPDIIQYPKFSQLTDSGTLGDATKGSFEKGKMLVERVVSRIVDFLESEWGYIRKKQESNGGEIHA